MKTYKYVWVCKAVGCNIDPCIFSFIGPDDMFTPDFCPYEKDNCVWSLESKEEV